MYTGILAIERLTRARGVQIVAGGSHRTVAIVHVEGEPLAIGVPQARLATFLGIVDSNTAHEGT